MNKASVVGLVDPLHFYIVKSTQSNNFMLTYSTDFTSTQLQSKSTEYMVKICSSPLLDHIYEYATRLLSILYKMYKKTS